MNGETEAEALAEARRLNSLGLKALDSGDSKAAVELLERAAAIDRNAPPIWMNLAKAHRSRGDDAAERLALERVLDLDRRHVMARIRLAELHERLGEESQATEQWSAVLALVGPVEDPPEELRALIDHARAFVGERSEALEKAMKSALAEDITAASPGDRRRAEAAVGALLGRRQIYASEPHGLHYPFLPADEFYDRDHFPWLARLEEATPVIRAELEAILAGADPGLEPYIEQEPGTPDNLWSKLDRSFDWSSLHLWRDGTRNDEACARAPKTAELVESLPLCRIPGRAPAVFFSILKAGKSIPPHTGVTNVRTIVHLALNVPDGCQFRVGGEIRPWIEGKAFAFDDTIEHEAWNPSDRDRAVLILDVWNPYLSEREQAMISTIFATLDSERGR